MPARLAASGSASRASLCGLATTSRDGKYSDPGSGLHHLLKPEAWRLKPLNLLQPEDAVFQIDSDAILAQELVSDDPAKLKAEQGARCIQIQHDHREVRVFDGVERQVHARQQERVFIPA